MRALAWGWLTMLLTWQSVAAADTADPGAARAHLQQGYALKRQGNCLEAIDHFAESVRLDRTPKGLLNLSDCEEKVGKLIAAQTHAIEARDLAVSRDMADFEKLAQKQLNRLDKQVPQLVLQLAKDAPPDTIIVRDGVELRAMSFGRPLPIDPGAHVVVARGGGLERKYDVTLAEHDVKTMEVSPVGGVRVAPDPGLASSQDAAAFAAPSSSLAPSSSSASKGALGPSEVRANATWSPTLKGAVDPDDANAPGSTQRAIGIIVGGIGVAALATSAVLAISAKSQWNDATEPCPNRSCSSSSAVERANAARDLGNVATGVFVGGLAGVVAGGILWATAPSRSNVGFWVTPTIGVSSGGVAISGQY